MDKESLKKIIATVATLLAAIGLADIADVFHYIADNIQVLWTAISGIIAIISAYLIKRPEDKV